MCLRACKHMLHDAAEWSGEIRQSHKRAASSPSERVKTCLREDTRMIKLGPRRTAGAALDRVGRCEFRGRQNTGGKEIAHTRHSPVWTMPAEPPPSRAHESALTAGPQQLISPKTRQHDQHLLIVSNGPAAEDLGTSSAARQLLNIVLAVQDKIGRPLRLSGGGYYHPFVATELCEPAF